MRYEQVKPPIVRLPPKSGLEQVIGHAAKGALLLLGLLAILVMLRFGRPVLVPVTLAVVIGLMLGPRADRLEKAGLPTAVSAGLVVAAFLVVILAGAAAFAVPLSDWFARLPLIWQRIQIILADWRGTVQSVSALAEQLKSITGDPGNMEVTVDEGGPAAKIALLAPAFFAQALIFLASLYFFLSTRHDIRILVLRICMSRRLRWRMAHIFRDAEIMVSRYLISITAVNVGLGTSVGLAMYLLGLPSPFLWGFMAAVLNYVIYIGPAIMAMTLLGAGLATFSTLPWVLIPAATYLLLNFVEAQFVTPQVVGRQLTINPFVVFLAIVFWLWMWGPAGGFVAVPLLLILTTAATHILPLMPQREGYRERPGDRSGQAG